MEKWPLGVFASIDVGLGIKLEVLRELAVPTVQIHSPSRQKRSPEEAQSYLDRLRKMKISVSAVFVGFEGESYADIPTVAKTVGLVPPATRVERLVEMKEISDFTKLLHCDVVGQHLGFVPHDTSDPVYQEVLATVQDLCDYLKSNGQSYHLETGQETADGLLQFIRDVDRDNLFVNFDPANMILYGIGDPIEALRKVGGYVRSVHCKDAKWAAKPGEEWGSEERLGDGEVGMERFLRTLDEIGYTGPLTVEREIPHTPDRQKEEIGHAIRLLSKLKAKIG